MAENKLIEKITDNSGLLKLWPTKSAKQLEVLKYLADKFDFDTEYSEKQVNEMLNRWHKFNDPALLRREFIEKGLFQRTPTGSKYWRVVLNDS